MEMNIETVNLVSHLCIKSQSVKESKDMNGMYKDIFVLRL